MTLECRFKPGVGPLPIRFGMSRGEVEQCFGFKARQFFRTQSSAFPAHEYCHDDGTVFVYFTGSGTVEAVEFDDRARITWDNYLSRDAPARTLVVFSRARVSQASAV